MLSPNCFIDVCDIPPPDPCAVRPVAHIDEKTKTRCSPWAYMVNIWPKNKPYIAYIYAIYTPDIPTVSAYC